MLFDIDRLAWSDELCELFGVPMEMLPDVRPSSGDFGVSTTAILGAEIPILGIAGDQQAALFGQGCVDSGNGEEHIRDGRVSTPEYRDTSGPLRATACSRRSRATRAADRCTHSKRAIFIAGAAVQWLRDGLGIIEKASDTEAMARSIESTGGVYFVPALTGLGAPHWDADARGTIVGLTRGTNRAHIARAALEAMAYGTAEVLSTMSDATGTEPSSIACASTAARRRTIG